MSARGPPPLAERSSSPGMQTNGGPRPRIRISPDPGEIAAALPYLLGFRPERSVVLVALGGEDGDEVRLTVRADLPPPRSQGPLAADLARRIVRDGAAAAIVAVVSEDGDLLDAPGGPDLPHRDLVHALVLELAAAGVPVREAMLVRGGRCWSFDCPHPCCAPGGGTPLPEGVSEFAAATVADGQVVAEDRAALVARLAPSRDDRGEVLAAVLRIGQECASRLLAVGRDRLADESWTAITDAVGRLRPGSRAGITDAAAARVAWGLRDLVVRDRAVALALGDDARAAEQLWTECVRRMPPPLDAAPATLLALSTWLRGDGATAGLALQRARVGDPGYTLAATLEDALDAGVPPTELRAWVTAGLEA
jgi:hypothetical protein